ncbi:bifunctional aspartokinase II/homoserine dehydrogenase II [Salmonella enterica subsp. enterica]|nr:bifunctional aspartokinase II/homoserine dehydrogenase II [Salmonella enterica subsp. enterica]
MNKARFPRVLVFEFVLAGVVDSRRSLLNYEGLDASRALAFFDDEAVEQDEESLFLWMRAHPYDDLSGAGCNRQCTVSRSVP